MHRRVPTLIALLAVISASCSGGGGGAAEVLYRAEGSAESAEITYVLDGEDVVEIVSLPFELTTAIGGDFRVGLTVLNAGDEGDVTCLLQVAGFNPVSAAGEAMATCTGSGSIGGSTASAAFASDWADRAADPDAPLVGEPYFEALDGSRTSVVAETDDLVLVIPFEQLTSTVEIAYSAEVSFDFGRSGYIDSNSGETLSSGDMPEWPAHQLRLPLPGPWEEGDVDVVVEVTLRDVTGSHPDVEGEFDLTFTVDPAATPSTVAYGDPQGRFGFGYPSSWEITSEAFVPGIFVTRIDSERPGYAADPNLLVDLVRMERNSAPGVSFELLTDPAVFTAPADVREWVDLHLASLDAAFISTQAVALDHGPGVRYRAEVGGVPLAGLATRSGPRFYAAEITGAGDDLAAIQAEGEAIFDSFSFAPGSEPPPGPLAEARSLTFTLGRDGQPVMNVSVALPATWDVEAVEILDDGRIVFALLDPNLVSSQFHIIAEVIPDAESTVAVDDYADFYLDNIRADGASIDEQGPGTVDGKPSVEAVWSTDGKVVHDTYVMVADFGVRIQMEFAIADDNPELFDTVILFTIEFAAP